MFAPSRISRLLAVALFAGFLAACTTTSGGGYFNPSASSDVANLPPAAAMAIAEDMAAKLAERVGTGTGTIVLKPGESSFHEPFIEALREWGYAIAVDKDVEGDVAIPLAYTINTSEESVMVRISTSSVELTRIYTVSGEGAAPASPLSVLSRAESEG